MDRVTHLGGKTNAKLIEESDGTLHVLETGDVNGAIKLVEAHKKTNYSNKIAGMQDMAMEKAYEIPEIILQQWCNEAGITDPFGQEAYFLIEKKMRDPQYAKFNYATKSAHTGIIMTGLK